MNQQFSSIGSQMQSDSVAGVSSATKESLPRGQRQTHFIVDPIYENLALCALFVALVSMTLLQFRRLIAKKRDEETEKRVAPSVLVQRTPALQKVLAKRNEILTRLEGTWEAVLQGHAMVETYMSRDIFSVDPDTPKEVALEKLKEQGFRRCMVTDAEGHLKGVVSLKDIACKPGEKVSDVMTNKPRVATPTMEVHIALTVLLENRISCLPVVKNGLLVGVVSTSDLLMVLQCLLLEISLHRSDVSGTSNDRPAPPVAPNTPQLSTSA
ncbi:CBS domain-containing protein [Stieleria varia]|nr:CBS domain-containing protein [Stieleria varia]